MRLSRVPHRLRHIRDVWAYKTFQSMATGAEIRPDDFAAFGEGSWILAPVRVEGREYIHIGAGVQIAEFGFIGVRDAHQGAYVPKLTIEDRVVIGRQVLISCNASVTIGEAVLASDRVFIGDSFHEYRDVTRPILDQGQTNPLPVVIGAGAFLGVGAVVLPGVTIGRGAVIGANAVVTSDIPDFAVAAGNPARVIRRWDGDDWTRC